MKKWKFGLMIAFLSITIAEYATGSTPLTEAVTNPAAFFLFSLPALLGLYGCGVILIREAAIAWNKSWPTVLLLGVAYGIMEEGVAVHTFFAPVNSTVGVFGQYGRILDVNVTWAVIISIFHSLFSIALPILISVLLFPESRNQKLLTRRSLTFVLLAYGITVLFLDIAAPYRPPIIYSVFLLAVALVLVYAGKHLPTVVFKRDYIPSTGRSVPYLVLGLAFFPFLIFASRLQVFLPSIVLDIEMIVVTILVYREIEKHTVFRSEKKLSFFLTGLTIPLMFFGFIVAMKQNPLGIIAILALILIDYRVVKTVTKREKLVTEYTA